MPKKKHNRRNKKGKGSNNANAASAPRTDKSSINNVNREDSDDLVAEFMSNTDRALKEFDNLTDEEKQNRGEDMEKVNTVRAMGLVAPLLLLSLRAYRLGLVAPLLLLVAQSIACIDLRHA